MYMFCRKVKHLCTDKAVGTLKTPTIEVCGWNLGPLSSNSNFHQTRTHTLVNTDQLLCIAVEYIYTSCF